MESVKEHEASTLLRDAAIQGRLQKWTEALTAVVIASCEAHGWKGAARGHRSTLLPVARQEYLSLDVVAFDLAGERCWRSPHAVFELENSQDDDRVAYSLWKVLCVRSRLRVVFCYRRDREEGGRLVRDLSKSILSEMAIGERAGLGGETLLVTGCQNEAETFPYGFFKEWVLDLNTGRFSRT